MNAFDGADCKKSAKIHSYCVEFVNENEISSSFVLIVDTRLRTVSFRIENDFVSVITRVLPRFEYTVKPIV